MEKMLFRKKKNPINEIPKSSNYQGKIPPLCERQGGGVLATTSQSWAAKVKGLLPALEVD